MVRKQLQKDSAEDHPFLLSRLRDLKGITGMSQDYTNAESVGGEAFAKLFN